MALIEAMKAAGSTEPKKYLPALQKLEVSGITGTIAFDKNGDIRDGGVTMYRFGGGKWNPLN
jgi:branched-chain amino acid transport system substrate-binding protein